MNRGLSITVFLFCSALALSSCAQQPKAANADQAIEQSKSMKTVEEQSKYLVDQANSFINSQNFDQAVQTAKYVLASLDANSQEAKSILEKAAEELKKAALQKAEEVKKSLGNLGQK